MLPKLFSCSGWVGLLLLCTSVEAQTPLRLAPQKGVLLLHNGEVLGGKITRAGDHFFVSMEDGEIRIKTADVRMFCDTLDEGYQRQRAHIRNGTAIDHLDLAEWCLRNQLLGHAAQELSQAMRLDPRQPRIPLIERRLELAHKPPQALPRAASPPDLSPTNEELDRLMRGMPPGSVETFTSTVQPLLLNHCSTAGCHGPRSDSRLKLWRVPLSKSPSRRLTQRNLHAVLEFIDRDDPGASTLLTASLRQHGDTKAPPFSGVTTIGFQQLAAWVQDLGRHNPAPRPTSVVRPLAPLLQTTPAKPVADPETAFVDEDDEASPPNMAAEMPAAETPAAEQAGFVQESKADRATAYTPVDPFDPEIFNRRFFPQSGDR